MAVDLRPFWDAVENFAVVDMPVTVSAEAERRLRACLAAGGPGPPGRDARRG